MGKAINELDNSGSITDATIIPVGETDTLKKTTWATIKSTLKTYFDTLYQSASANLTSWAALATSAKQDTLVSGTNIKTINSTSILGSGDIAVGASIAPLVITDANTVEQYNSTTAQAFRLYNTRTDASNYERGFMRWASNVFEIGTEKLGTGTARALRFIPKGDTNSTLTLDASGYAPLLTGGLDGIDFASSCKFSGATDTNVRTSWSSIGRDWLVFAGVHSASSVGIKFRANWGYDQAVPTLTFRGCDQYSGNTTNIVGGGITITGGAGASGSAGAAHGGALNFAGGVGYGSGAAGDVNLAYTGSAARGTVKCWGTLTMDAAIVHKSYTVATLPSASTSGAGAQAFVTDANATTARSTVAGGGSNKVNVFSDGTNWLIAA